VKINPLEILLWTFRRNENDVVNIYNTLSPAMQLATGGNMLNFGLWDESDMSAAKAQNRLCDVIAHLAELDSGKSLLDVGSGLSSPAIRWTESYPDIEIWCVNINYLQLQAAKNYLRKKKSSPAICEINATSTMLPFSKKSMERIVALESAQHFRPFENFISESSRVLKKDGILTFAIPVAKKNLNLINLGILTLTWASEHYSKNFVIRMTSKKFDIVEKMEVGQDVYDPLVDYYVKNRRNIQKMLLKQYPSYVENILYKSLLKMKKASREKLIDYLLIKCVKSD
jgi:cyclopropane fatty-acyl-phospholipid synthase-like methyltransferase|tara:strand:- start:452 stop:1306 length:855 start_codon:yes stop_codon:yes gene_type:complete